MFWYWFYFQHVLTDISVLNETTSDLYDLMPYDIFQACVMEETEWDEMDSD